ncbi:endonuclease-reverse transcriptase [Plakobranchus ocellatus]|uniref:Endonuclease-reverse transcriptase n=1 Tax=Plakobranchus ocellatus TaxID=259542 RepID=A0AAV3Z7A4_9GAST|nr:endonuclease-reverse transcriptase [Plakobranchus ocellatus]
MHAILEDSPHLVKSKFCLRSRTATVTGDLCLIDRPLQCRIQVNKTEGILEILRMVVWPEQERSCIQVTFPNLTAFTTYTLSVVAAAGDETSDPVVLTFITAKTIPLQPPVLSNHSFLRYSTGQDSVLLILWQALPHEVRGGASVTYDLELFSDNGLELARSNLTETSLVTTDPLPHGSLSLKLRARNELGQSQNFSSLNIPAFSEITPVPFVVNFARNKIHLHFQKPLPRSQFRQMVTHLCTSYTRYGEIDLCTVATYNTRIIRQQDDLERLLEELEQIKWHIIGLSEIKRGGEGLSELPGAHWKREKQKTIQQPKESHY